MALIVKDRIKEVTTTTGTGTITLAGASTGFRSFADIGNANTTYYCISGGSQFEVGIGTYTASGTTLSRDTVLSNSLGTTAKIAFSAGTKDVFVTYPSDKALLGTTSAVASTGTGSVVLNSNPSFATDITVNGLTAGRGAGSVSTNTAFGVDALSTTSNGAGTLTILPGSSGTYGDYLNIQLEYVSGTPATTYPIVDISVDGEIYSYTIKNAGSGFVDTTTIMKVPDGEPFSGQFQVASFTSRFNTIGIGQNAGTSNPVGNNNIYIGNGAVGTLGANNEIIIGSTTGNGSNTIKIGNSSQTISFANLNAGNAAVSALTTSQIIPPITELTIGVFGQPLNMYLAAGTDITIDSPITNIGIDSDTGSPKTVNIGTSATAGGNVAVNIGKAVGTSTTTINGAVTLSAVSQTINIGAAQTTGVLNLGTNASRTGALNIGTGSTSGTKPINIGTNGTGTTNIAIGSTAGTSTTTLNGAVNAVNDATVNGIKVGKGAANIATNIAIGQAALTSASTTGGNNLSICGLNGFLVATSGNTNIGIGNNTFRQLTTGIENVAVGSAAIENNTTSSNNTALGTSALRYIFAASNNVGIGHRAGSFRTGTNVNLNSPSSGVYIGAGCLGAADSETNSIVIGAGAQGLGSNTTVIGTSATTQTKVFGAIQSTTYTVATLPSAATVGVGARAFVTNALDPVFGAAVAGGGAVPVPVYSTGSAWNVG